MKTLFPNWTLALRTARLKYRNHFFPARGGFADLKNLDCTKAREFLAQTELTQCDDAKKGKSLFQVTAQPELFAWLEIGVDVEFSAVEQAPAATSEPEQFSLF